MIIYKTKNCSINRNIFISPVWLHTCMCFNLMFKQLIFCLTFMRKQKLKWAHKLTINNDNDADDYYDDDGDDVFKPIKPQKTL